MNNRYLLENSYNANYEAAKKFVENFDWVAAKEAFTKAALAASIQACAFGRYRFVLASSI